MSTSLLYHGFDVSCYHYLRTEYSRGAISFHIAKNAFKQRCAVCGSKDVVKKGNRVRRIHTVPIGLKPVFLCIHLYRLKCKKCGSLRQEEILLSDPKKQWSRSLGRYVLELLRTCTVKDVARLSDCNQTSLPGQCNCV